MYLFILKNMGILYALVEKACAHSLKPEEALIYRSYGRDVSELGSVQAINYGKSLWLFQLLL